MIKTITAFQYDDLVSYKRVIQMHQDIIAQLYEQVTAIVPDEGCLGGGLFDAMHNDFNTLEVALDRLGIKVNTK